MYSLNMMRLSRLKTAGIGIATLAAVSALASIGAQADASSVANLNAKVAVRATATSQLLRDSRFINWKRTDSAIQIALVLPLRNETDLRDTLRRIYDPHDPSFHQYITGAEFDAKYGPTQADYDAVTNFAIASGFQIVQRHSSRTLLSVRGTVQQMQNVFGTKIANYQMRDGAVRFANVSPATLPAEIANKVKYVVGLSDIGLHLKSDVHTLAPHLHAMVTGQPREIGTGPSGALAPTDIINAYNLSDVLLKGDGQALALFELDGYATTDIATYTKQFGLPDANLQNVYVDGYPGTAGSGAVEVVLDIDMMLALAPRASKIYVYEAANGGPGLLDEYTQIADDYGTTKAASVSSSWGIDEASATGGSATENQIFMKMAAQGQSVYAAAGDTGAYDNGTTLSVDDPASQPFVTGVGGTRLQVTAPGGTYSGETTWNTSPLPNPEGGGGGSSIVWPKPAYQMGLGASKTNRDVPDVSLDADPDTGYDIYVASQGGWFPVGGTSAAAPLWAALTGLVNEQRAVSGLTTTLGQSNPALYAIAANTTNYAKAFHDITVGTNLFYPAGPGYDDATGLGSFIGDSMISFLAAGTANLPQGTLAGTVTDINNKPILGVTIKAVVTGLGVTAGSVVTGADGTYTMSLGAGPTYTVSADAPGFAGRAVKVNIIAATTTTLNFTLLQQGHVYPAQTIEMISAPYDYTSVGDFSLLFGLSDPLGVSDPRLYAWDASSLMYIASPDAPSDTIRIGQGYWVRFPGVGPWYLHREGVPANAAVPFRIALQAGWNQIGDPFLVNAPVSTLQAVDQNPTSTPVGIATSPLILGPIYRYIPGTGYTALTSTDVLNDWEGYWIHASAPSSLIVPAPPTPVSGPG